MMRPLLLFVIGLLFGVGGGFLAAGGLPAAPHDHGAHDHTMHDHSNLRAWDGPAPDLNLAFTRAPDDQGVNLHVVSTGFSWAPEDVDTPSNPGNGHAHIYINGEKIMRAYGPWTHLPHVAPGDIVNVTLNTNDHETWAVDGEPIQAQIIIP